MAILRELYEFARIRRGWIAPTIFILAVLFVLVMIGRVTQALRLFILEWHNGARS